MKKINDSGHRLSCLSCLLLLLVLCLFTIVLIESSVKTIVLGLSYGFISGVIIYLLTVKYPECLKKKRFEPDINSEIDNLATLLLRSLLEVNKDNLTLVSDREYWRTSMYSVDWNKQCQSGPHIGNTVFESLHIEFDKVQKEIVLIETVYKDILSDDINSSLMLMYNSDVFSLVDDFLRAKSTLGFKSDSDNRSFFVDRIIDLLDNFEKVSVLVSGQKRSGYDENGMIIKWS